MVIHIVECDRNENTNSSKKASQLSPDICSRKGVSDNAATDLLGKINSSLP
jgi:hypothetical protein